MALLQDASEQEIVALDLDYDLLYHLAIPESINRLRAEMIGTEVIEDEFVEQVFKWQMDHYREHTKPADGAVLEHEFEELALEPPLAAIDDLIGRLRQRYVKNHGAEALETLIETYREEPANLTKVMAEQQRELARITTRRGDSYGPGDVDRSLAEYDAMVLRGRGPTLGFEDIDDHFHGQRNLTFMIGAPKTMKSWMTTNAVVESVSEGRCVAYFPLEIGAHEAYQRVLHMAADVPWWKFLKGGINSDERKKIKEAGELLDGCGVLHIIKPPPGERTADHLVDVAHDLSADVLFIDQLQYMETRRGQMIGSANDTGVYWEVLATLRDYSDTLPTWIVHQFNRNVMFADELPPMQQIKGSAAIEETATLALGLWANKDMRSSKIVQCGTLASRNYEWVNWDFSVQLSRACRFDLIGRVDDE